MVDYPRQGEIWDVDFDPVLGREQGGIRPALVVSKNGLNSNPGELCVVAAITSRQRGWMAHVNVPAPEGGLTVPSAVMCDQIRSVSLVRFIRRRGTVEPPTLAAVIRLIHQIVGL